jgi:formylglycine-generating enzyme required for sulfatase activity
MISYSYHGDFRLSSGCISHSFQSYEAMQKEVDAFEIRQERVETLAAGGAGFVPFGKDQPPRVIFATATQIAALNNLDSQHPVVDEAYKAQYGVEMVQVPTGCFWMGSVIGDSDEQPVHEVCFDEPFWIDRYEVTYGQFDRLKGEAAAAPSWTNLNQPRTSVTWFEAWDFCVKRGAYMPTERQWEYAARGPNSPQYPWGNDLPEIYYYLNSPDFADSYVDEPVDAGSNSQDTSRVGAHDMSGNVSEWVSSVYSGKAVIRYPAHFDLEYDNLPIGGLRIVRGGSYESEMVDLRAAARDTAPPEDATDTIGFRCARSGGP